MKGLITKLNQFSDFTGKTVAWLAFAMMLISCWVVLMRYGFNIGSIALQESVSYLHATVFLLGAAYTLKENEHVRVDIFYQRFSPRQKAWVDAIGTLVFLFPFIGLLLATSWHFFLNALAIREASSEPGGLAYLYLFKGLMPLASLLLIIQGISLFLESALALVIKEGAE